MRLSDYWFPNEKPETPSGGYVRRPRISCESPISVIVGGPGLGKSAFLAELCERSDAPSVYLRLDAADNDPDRLAAHIFSALKSLVGESFCDDEVTSATLVSQSLRALCENRALLLIDNADLVSETNSSAILEGLLLPTADSAFSAAIAGRHVPGFLLPFILRSHCREITARELAFTADETAHHIGLRLPSDCAVVNVFSGDSLPIAAVQLNAFAGGLPAAEAMILREITANDDRELDLPSACEHSLLRRFVADVISRLEPSLADFVCKTAFIPNCDETTARVVFGETAYAEKSAYLKSHGILVLTTSKSAHVEYPPAISQALSRLISHDDRRILEDKAVDYYVSSGRISDAVSMLGETGDADAVERLLALHGERLLSNCEFELIGYCAEIIDRYQAPSDPSVLGILGQYNYYRGQYDEMERVFNMADSMFGKDNIYSTYRGIYNGLLKFENNPELYTENLHRFSEFLRTNSKPLPFLYPKDRELYERVTEVKSASARTLTMRRFGGFSLKMLGSDILFRTKKACEFMALMAERTGRPIERDRLIGSLWSENMPESAVAMLHNIIYSLRRELNLPELRELISYKDKCYALDISLIDDADAEIFELCRAIKGMDTAALVAKSEHFENYWGSYLANLDCHWAIELREHYDRLFVEGSLLLAAHFHGEGDFTRELVCLKNASAIEPYSEKIIRELIYCHVAHGHPNRARSCYEKYCAFIADELGIEPSKWLKKEYLACFAENRD